MIGGGMPQPSWNYFIPKDGNSQSAKNKWNSWPRKWKNSSIFKKTWFGDSVHEGKQHKFKKWLVSAQT